MKTAICELESFSPYGQGKYHSTEKESKELAKDYEARTWKERAHYDDDGKVFIPPMVFKNCLSEAAKYLKIQIPGEGKSTWTKHFEAGILVTDPLYIGVIKDDLEGEWLFVPSDGVRGGGKRVEKRFPVIKKWKGKVSFLILDEKITQDVFTHHLESAGNFIGIGRFRPRNNGYYGRFKVVKVEWKDGV